MKIPLFFYCCITLFSSTQAVLIKKAKHLPPSEGFEEPSKEALNPFCIDLVRENKHEILAAYLEKNQDIINQYAIESGRTLLHCAVECNNSVIITLLLEKGANPNNCDKSGATPLHYAVRCSPLETVKQLIEAGGDVQACDNFGLGTMHYSVINQLFFENIISYLIMLNVNINQQDEIYATPLHYAVIKNICALQCLIKAGANVDIPDHIGNRPLHYAALENKIKALEIILSYPHEINATNIHGHTPLHYALARDNFKIATLLLEKEASVEMPAANEPLIFFVIRHSSEKGKDGMEGVVTFRLLLQKGMDPYVLYKPQRAEKRINARSYAIEQGKFYFAEVIRVFINNSQRNKDLSHHSVGKIPQTIYPSKNSSIHTFL